MIETHSIQHQFKGSQRFNFPDINCKSEQTLLIIGASGVGKTTLLHILAGILKPDEGSVIIGKESVYKLPQGQRDKFRGKNIGLIFQKPHFIHSVNARENLKLAREMANLEPDPELIDSMLDRLHLKHRSTAKVSQMSQGELQRLSIARAMINAPKLILADEPTSALDDSNCHEVVHLLQTHARDAGASLIIVTHDTRLKSIFPNYIELN